MTEFEIAATHDSPHVSFHCSQQYGMYQWARQIAATNPQAGGDNSVSESLSVIRDVANSKSVNGIWSIWEGALATGSLSGNGIASFQKSFEDSGKRFVHALEILEPYYQVQIWPSCTAQIQTALATIENVLSPVFPGIATEHASLLNMQWPDQIDVFLVAHCHSFAGAYSHPLTIDVTLNTGHTLCETIVHEMTHVADVSYGNTGSSTLADRTMGWLMSQGMPRNKAFNIWHALIFASSASRIRQALDPVYVDYASARNLYAFFGIPGAPAVWREFEFGGRNEHRLFESILVDNGMDL